MAARVTLVLRAKPLFVIIVKRAANIGFAHARISGVSAGCAYVPHTAAPVTVINMSCSVTASPPPILIASAKCASVCLVSARLCQFLKSFALLEHKDVTLMYPLSLCTMVAQAPYLQL